MKKLLLLVLLLAQAIQSQQMWRPMGRNDWDLASLGTTNLTKYPIWARNNAVYLFSIENIVNEPVNKRIFFAKHTGSWEDIDVPFLVTDAVKPGTVVDQNGIPYVFFNDPVNNNFRAKKYTGEEWVDMGENPISATTSSYINPLLASDGTIFIIYNGGIKKWDGNDWITVTSSPYAISTSSVFALGPDNTIYVMYNYGTASGDNYNCFVKKWNGTYWEEVGITDFTGKGIAFDVDNNGFPHLYINHDLLKFDGNSWVEVSNHYEMGLSAPGWGMPDYEVYDMKFDDADTLYIQTQQSNTEWGGLKRWVNGVWQNVSGGGVGYSRYNFTVENGIVYKLSVYMAPWPYVGKITSNSVEFLDGPEYFMGEHDFTVCNDYPMIASRGAGGKAEVRWYNNNEWGILSFPGISENDVVKTEIKAAGDGQIYIAYNNIISATERKITVKRFASPDWLPLGDVNFSLSAGDNFDLAVSHAYEPYVIYKSGRVQKFDGANWIFVGGTAYNGDVKSKLIFDSNDVPHIVKNTEILKFNGTNWNPLPLPDLLVSGTIDSNFKAAFDSQDNLYLAYIDTSYKVRVLKWNGSTWATVGSETVTSQETTLLDFAIDRNDIPYVFSNENVETFYGKANVRKFNGTDWEFVGNSNFSKGSISAPQLDFSSNNTPMVSYRAAYGSYFKYFGEINGWLDTEEPVLTNTESIAIIPNPVNNYLTVAGKDISQVVIFDLTGKKVIEQKSTSVDASRLQSGMYVLKAVTPQGTVNSKFIKQ